jgi:hypothetical protein
MISYEQKQKVIRSANDAQAQARSVLAKCVAGLAAVVLLVIAGTTFEPRVDAVPLAGAAADRAEGSAATARRETFEGRRAYYEVERRAAEPRQSASR